MVISQVFKLVQPYKLLSRLSINQQKHHLHIYVAYHRMNHKNIITISVFNQLIYIVKAVLYKHSEKYFKFRAFCEHHSFRKLFDYYSNNVYLPYLSNIKSNLPYQINLIDTINLQKIPGVYQSISRSKVNFCNKILASKLSKFLMVLNRFQRRSI